MSTFLRTINHMAAASLAVMLLAVAWSPVAEAATRRVKCGKDDLQTVIAAAVNGDTIEITGICPGNFRIDGKDLTLVGARAPGPHGIDGVAADTAALIISRSNNTHLENLSISDSALHGVLALYSFVSMSNCTVSRNGWNGINVSNSSRLEADHLLLEANVRGAFFAGGGSYASCMECDFNGNLRFAAVSTSNSVVTLLDSAVTGRSGIASSNHSYIDIDCQSFDDTTPHDCSLHVNETAGTASAGSTVVFYGAGDFWGQVQASEHSVAQLLGARQLSTGVLRDASNTNPNATPRSNEISSGAELRVEPLDGTVAGRSQLMGTTNVSEFSHALLYGTAPVGPGAISALVGSLNCMSGGDAWVDAEGVDLTNGSINDCDHAP
jgi:hypothetical protein